MTNVRSISIAICLAVWLISTDQLFSVYNHKHFLFCFPVHTCVLGKSPERSRNQRTDSVSMDKRETSDFCAFDKLFATNVPHVHEKIFLSLDYFSFKSCLTVNKSWNELLTSESFLKKAKSTFDEWLVDAAFEGHTDIVKLLLNLGAEPDKPVAKGWTALHFAAYCDNKGVVKVLLNGGANPNMTDDSGQSPLIRAVFYHHIDMVKILLDGGADPNIGILCG